MKNKQLIWFVLALLGALLAAPNAMVLKLATGNIDPYFVNMLRFGIVMMFCLPFMLGQRKVIRKKTGSLCGIGRHIACNCGTQLHKSY